MKFYLLIFKKSHHLLICTQNNFTSNFHSLLITPNFIRTFVINFF